MKVDYKDTELLEKCADMIHELYNYISVLNQTHRKQERLNEQFEALRADIKLARKSIKEGGN